ncbi:MAG: hypothetical protein H6Q70_489 [Firmicutes bacterium]|nr:hypothetical protein [Bacillota bacterium]
MLEHDIQNSIRLAISENKLGVSFRTNVGQGWTGEKIIKNPNGSITIFKPRPFDTGLPTGFSDLLVINPTIISPKMVGKQIAIAGFIEVKNLRGKPTTDQENFIERMQELGAKAGIARSPDDALKILRS